MLDKSYFLVFVPGYMGSVLRDENADQTVWVDISTALGSPAKWFERMKFPENGISNLKATKVMDKIIIVNPFASDEGYMKLWDMFEQFGLKAHPARHAEADLDVHAFPYDWRQDNVQSAKELKAKIEHLKTHVHPGREAWIMAHSNGGVVARWYIEQLGGKDVVSKLILLGSPWDGTPKVVQIAITGAVFLSAISPCLYPAIQALSRNLFRTFPSLYQLIPLQNSFLKNSKGNPVNPFDGSRWLDNARQSQYLAAGKKFIETLGDANSVDTICLYGRDISTVTGGIVEVGPSGRWQRVKWERTFEGDSTIPEISGRHPNADTVRDLVVLHSRFHLEPPATLRLGQVLGKEPITMAVLITERYKVVFKPNRNVYTVGKPMRLDAKVTERETGRTVKQVKATVNLEWAQEMPGDPEPILRPAPRPVRRRLMPAGNKLSLTWNAPKKRGYYRLTATVVLPAFAEDAFDETHQVQLSELIAVKS